MLDFTETLPNFPCGFVWRDVWLILADNIATVRLSDNIPAGDEIGV